MCRRMMSVVGMAMVLIADCHAQFIDDFNGNTLAPHWTQPPLNEPWVYEVSGGMLHVQNLLFPSSFKNPVNSALLTTQFNPVAGDFFARAIVGWDPGQERGLEWSVGSSTALLGKITYGEGFASGSGIAVQGGSTQPMMFPAPPPGLHEFALRRQSGTMFAYVDGTFLVNFPAAAPDPAAFVGLFFSIAYPNSGMQPLHVDLVQIVPSPATPVVLVGLTHTLWSRKRRSCPGHGNPAVRPRIGAGAPGAMLYNGTYSLPEGAAGGILTDPCSTGDVHECPLRQAPGAVG